MEKMMMKVEDERALMISELTQGREYAKQLQNQILDPWTPQETRDDLLQKICSSYSRVLSIINPTKTMTTTTTPHPLLPMGGSDHHYFDGATTSLVFQQPPSQSLGHNNKRHHYLDDDHTNNTNVNGGPSNNRKKRKMLPKWSESVKVCSSNGSETGSLLNDGFSWRKYGQKDILGSTQPRNYYRCTYRNTQGCPATKQVQKSDDDPTIVQVIYRGHHSCQRSSVRRHMNNIPHKPASANHDGSAVEVDPDLKPLQQQQQQQQQQQLGPLQPILNPIQIRSQPPQQQESLLGRELPSIQDGQVFFRSFSFSTAIFDSAEDLTNGGLFFTGPASDPAADFAYFTSQSPCLNVESGSGSGFSVGTPESVMNEALSAQDSAATNSPVEGLEYFTLDEMGIDPDFNFDNPEIFI